MTDNILLSYKNHPAQKEIFLLAILLKGLDVPYYFNFEQDLRPTPFKHDGEDPESINWDKYLFQISIDLSEGVEKIITQREKGLELTIRTYDECKGYLKSVATGLTADKALEFIIA